MVKIINKLNFKLKFKKELYLIIAIIFEI